MLLRVMQSQDSSEVSVNVFQDIADVGINSLCIQPEKWIFLVGP